MRLTETQSNKPYYSHTHHDAERGKKSTMTVDDNLFLENIKALRGDMAGVRGAVEELTSRVTTLEIGQSTILNFVSVVSGDVARQQASFDRINARVTRIERRLELVDDPKGEA
jgi:uncharacterized coiled-coil protein SlyX